MSTAMFAQASTAAKEARLRSLPDLDAAALKLRDVGLVIPDETTPDAELRTAVFERVCRDAFAEAVERVSRLAEPDDDTFFTELRKSPGRLRYAPALLRGWELDAAPAGRAPLDAVSYLRAVQSGGRRPGPPPTAFAPKGWIAQFRTACGRFDLPGYRLAVLDGLRRAIRWRDVFPVRSLRDGAVFGGVHPPSPIPTRSAGAARPLWRRPVASAAAPPTIAPQANSPFQQQHRKTLRRACQA